MKRNPKGKPDTQEFTRKDAIEELKSDPRLDEHSLTEMVQELDKRGALEETFQWVPDDTTTASERLQWIFEFTALSEADLKKADIMRISLDVEKFLFQRIPYTGPRLNRLIIATEPTLEALASSRNLERVRSLQEHIKQILFKLERLFGDEESVAFEDKVTLSFEVFVDNWSGPPRLSVAENVHGDEYQEVFYELIQLLKDVPLDRIGKCEVCNRFFYHPKKGVRFCSHQCMWRENTRKYREKNPESYRKAQRIAAGKHRVKKVEKRLGPGPAAVVRERLESKRSVETPKPKDS